VDPDVFEKPDRCLRVQPDQNIDIACALALAAPDAAKQDRVTNPAPVQLCLMSSQCRYLEPARITRLQKAYADKFSKLATWKRDEGARTILVLEEKVLSLTNHQRVADALAPAEAAMPMQRTRFSS
jgi:hypothetical protein